MSKAVPTKRSWLITFIGVALMVVSVLTVIAAIYTAFNGDITVALIAPFLGIPLLCSLPLIYFGNIKAAKKSINSILDSINSIP